MQTLQPSPLQALLRSSWFVIQAAPKRIFSFTLLTLLQGGGPTLVLFLDKIIIDEITRLVQIGNIESDTALTLLLSNTLLLVSILGIIFLNLSLNSINTITNVMFSSLEHRVRGYFQQKFLDKVATFSDISLFENPELLNIVQLAEKAIERLQRLAMSLGVALIGMFTLIPAVAVSVTITWWVPLVVLLASAPAIFIKVRLFAKVGMLKQLKRLPIEKCSFIKEY